MNPYNKRYWSHRPFLVIDTYYHPAAHVITSKKGWGAKPENWRPEEIPYVVNRISDAIARRASIIIDLLEDKLIKDRQGKSPAHEVIAIYRAKYAGHVNQAMQLQQAREVIAEAEAFS